MSGRILLIDVPREWVMSAARLASDYRREKLSGRATGRRSSLVYQTERHSHTFEVWHSAHQVCVMFRP